MVEMLIVDDSEFDRNFLKQFIQRLSEIRDWKATFAASANEALSAIENHKFDILVTDVLMPNMSGIELMQEIHACGINIPVILISGDSSPELKERALKLGAASFLRKNEITRDLPNIIRSLFPD